MSADNVTPITEKRYTLEQASKVILSGFPCDLDTAGTCLSQARGVLQLVTEVIGGKGVNMAEKGPIGQSVWAALADIERAYEALFGPDQKKADTDEDDD